MMAELKIIEWRDGIEEELNDYSAFHNGMAWKGGTLILWQIHSSSSRFIVFFSKLIHRCKFTHTM